MESPYTGRRGVEVPGTQAPRRIYLVKRRLEAGMPRISWLLAAVAVLLLLVPASAVSYPPGLMATEISSAKVCGAVECREVSDPEAATALAVGPRPRGTDAPERGLPWYESTLTIRAEDGGEVSTDRRLRHRGALRRADALGGRGYLGDPAQREQRGLREAHSRAYAPPGEDVSGRGRGRQARSPASMRSSSPRARPPRRRRATARTFGSSRWAAAC